jgi:hypothetical protein
LTTLGETRIFLGLANLQSSFFTATATLFSVKGFLKATAGFLNVKEIRRVTMVRMIKQLEFALFV